MLLANVQGNPLLSSSYPANPIQVNPGLPLPPKRFVSVDYVVSALSFDFLLCTVSENGNLQFKVPHTPAKYTRDHLKRLKFHVQCAYTQVQCRIVFYCNQPKSCFQQLLVVGRCISFVRRFLLLHLFSFKK